MEGVGIERQRTGNDFLREGGWLMEEECAFVCTITVECHVCLQDTRKHCYLLIPHLTISPRVTRNHVCKGRFDQSVLDNFLQAGRLGPLARRRLIF